MTQTAVEYRSLSLTPVYLLTNGDYVSHRIEFLRAFVSCVICYSVNQGRLINHFLSYYLLSLEFSILMQHNRKWSRNFIMKYVIIKSIVIQINTHWVHCVIFPSSNSSNSHTSNDYSSNKKGILLWRLEIFNWNIYEWSWKVKCCIWL